MLQNSTKFFLLFGMVFLFRFFAIADPGDTTVVRTFRFDTNIRSGMFQFPNDPSKTYEKILMLYSMRCKDGHISNQTSPNIGCGEWDYNCFTYLIDSAQTDSLRQLHGSHTISNFNGTIYPYTTQAINSYVQYTQQHVTYTNVLSESTALLGNGTQSLTVPFGLPVKEGKVQYLWTAAELTSAGLTAGNITGIRLNFMTTGSGISNLRINMKHSQQIVLSSENPEIDGFTEVYFLNTPVNATGELSFNFYHPFTWDGVSNILLEYSYSEPDILNTEELEGHTTGSVMALSSTGDDGYLKMDGGIQIMKVNPAIYPQLSDQISIAFWCYGDPAKLPTNTTIMEGNGPGNTRQVNIHMPWSNSRIYWDCGYGTGNYDRIDQAATPEEIAGKWNFWTFTKNATTGIMNIWKNGHLWASGSGKTRLINLNTWVVGNAVGGGLSYYGNINELSIWKKDLDSAAISQLIMHSINASHPDYASLLAYYKFDELSGNIATDSGPNAWTSQLVNPGWRVMKGKDLFRSFTEESSRPNTKFVQGVYNSLTDTTFVLDSTVTIPASVVGYTTQNNNLLVTDTSYVWPSGFAYIYDPLGNKIDSIAVPAIDSIEITQLTYYQRRPMRIELINFITPYGKGLNLNGLSGKTWTFDVTDYATILKGPKFLAMSDGIYQEDNDITFIYYEGTPPRTVKSLSQIWPSGSWVSPSYNEIVNNRYFEPRNIALNANSAQFKVRSAISGHGQQGEFIPRNHSITLNDTVKFTWMVWKACADNPIYPQGGTWVYARAGWCPGAVVDTREYELTPYITPGQNITLDYSLPANMNPGASNYRVNNQLVSYGPANFNLDAAVAYIKSPSSRTEFARRNPICDEPVIAIKNTGSTPLNTLTISYGREGAPQSFYQWTGNLGFLETKEISLPVPDWSGSTINTFKVELSLPNGGQDEYAANDTLSSDFLIPAVYPSQIYFDLRTNYFGNENAYTLKDSQGNVIISRTALSDNTVYRDTVTLADGCYQVYMTDLGGDGLSFWANTNQGNGYFRIRDVSTGLVLKQYNPDFGDNIFEQFTVGQYLSVPETLAEKTAGLRVWPNPTSGLLQVEFAAKIGTTVDLTVWNMLGKQVTHEQIRVNANPEHFSIDTQDLKAGIYYLSIGSGTNREKVKFVVIK
jgi:hypothetical protein